MKYHITIALTLFVSALTIGNVCAVAPANDVQPQMDPAASPYAVPAADPYAAPSADPYGAQAADPYAAPGAPPATQYAQLPSVPAATADQLSQPVPQQPASQGF